MVADDPFSNTICSICFEDLKPGVEDLQSISLCGHVFHELWEVKKLESKVSVLKSTLDHRQGELKQTNEELHMCKEQLSNEKEKFQETLRTKSSELVKSSLECSGLREENLALAKELAALKQSYSDLMARSHAKVEKDKKEKDENPTSAKRLKAHREMYPTLPIEVFDNSTGAHSRKVGSNADTLDPRFMPDFAYALFSQFKMPV